MADPLEHLRQLLQRARALPPVPGVYLMKDAQGRVLYVGKASRLPDRLSSHFAPSADLDPKKQAMLQQIADFEVIECESEWEALLAENRLIKDLHPPFNVRLTDDKTYPYLVITTNQSFPGLYITRKPGAPEYKGARILGPFARAAALRRSVQLLQKVFRFRTCNLDIRPDDPKRRYFRPCLLYSLGQCSAPCADRVSLQDYRSDVERFLRFLDSKRSVLLRELRQEMEQAAQRLDFERAAALRDQIAALEKLDERASRRDHWQPEVETTAFYLDPRQGLEALRKTLALDQPIRCIEGIDIAHLQGGETVGSKVCFVDGRPLKNAYRRYRIQSASNDDYAAIREVVSRRYRDAGAGQELYPDLILIDGGRGQLHAAQEAFAQLKVPPPMVIALAKKEELIYIQGRDEPTRLARNNPALRLCQAIRDEAHRFAQHYHHILRRKKTLGQDQPPRKKSSRSFSADRSQAAPDPTPPDNPTR